MKKLVGHGCASERRIPPSVAARAIATLSTSASAGPAGQPLRGGGRCDHEREHEQDADDLDRLGGREREQEEDRDRERRSGTPRAAAISGSTLEKSSGR